MKRLIDGIEIIGKSQDSGYTVPLYLIKTPDGKFIQLTEILFYTVVALQNTISIKKAAAQMSKLVRMDVDEETITYLITDKLAPLGIITDAASPPKITKQEASMVLGLTARFTLVPQGTVTFLAKIFRFLFSPFMIGFVLVGFAGINSWLFMAHGLSEALRQVLYQPFFLLVIIGLILVGTLFHEIGHATGCAYKGGTPSRIGAGLYVIWPAFFTDITDSYRLNRVARLYSDFGGIYFNAVFALIVAGIYGFTGLEPLLLLIFFQDIEMLQQLLPFLRLDGYYIVSDIVGVPNLFGWIKPILLNLFPGSPSTQTHKLKPWVRWVVTLWVVLTMPILGFFFWVMFAHAPEIFITAWDAILKQTTLMRANLLSNNYIMVFIRMFQLLLLLLPALGILVVFFRIIRKLLETCFRLAGDALG